MNDELGLSIDDRRKLQAFIDALALFADKDQNMPIQLVRSLVLAALNPGMNGKALGHVAGLSHTVVSRHLKDWGELNRHKEPGFKLIELELDRQDNRFKRPVFTPKGRTFVSNLLAVLRGK